MKIYEKPSMSVIELQLKENIAAVPTTVWKGKKSTGFSSRFVQNMALSETQTGLRRFDDDGDVIIES